MGESGFDLQPTSIAFIQTQLELVRTFCKTSKEAEDAGKRERNVQHAKRAFESAAKVFRGFNEPSEDWARVKASLDDGSENSVAWGCDTPLSGSIFQKFHADYQRQLFPEVPDLPLPTYMLVVNFGLVDIDENNGPIEIAPGTHRMPRERAMRLLEAEQLHSHTIPLEIGDVLIRHPRALHRGTPNRTDVPRAMVTVRYARRWYADASREVTGIPSVVWNGLTSEQQDLLRFPIQAG